MSDRRTLFATDRVAADVLRGIHRAPAFAQPWARSVAAPQTFLHREPAGPREREILHGDALDVIEDRCGWSFARGRKDGYCGWVRTDDLGPVVPPSHRVAVRATHVYPEASIKTPPVMRLSFGAGLAVRRIDGRWAESAAGWVYAPHLRAADATMADPVAAAALLLGTPYLWAGNTADGIDCSGLVQVACHACGIACPGDSDQQQTALGSALPASADFRRGDLLFWRGHVAWVADPATLLHANAYAMAVTYEPLQAAVARIEAQGDGPVTARRRL